MAKTVVAALLLENNRLLICQRSEAGEYPGKWEFPGGKMEPGETAAKALRRELEEELGIAAEIGEELWRCEYQYPNRPPVELVFFAVRRWEGAIENRIFQQIRWAAPAELGGYDFLEGDLALVAKLRAGEVMVRGD
jgi:8-oxo-dGTP diphosphatase